VSVGKNSTGKKTREKTVRGDHFYWSTAGRNGSQKGKKKGKRREGGELGNLVQGRKREEQKPGGPFIEVLK